MSGRFGRQGDDGRRRVSCPIEVGVLVITRCCHLPPTPAASSGCERAGMIAVHGAGTAFDVDELIEFWTLLDEDRALLAGKRALLRWVSRCC